MEGKAYLTAISRKKPSLPGRWLKKNGLIIPPALDYGCGRGADFVLGFTHQYDPYFFPGKKYSSGIFKTIACTYVLNVVTRNVEKDILEELHRLCADGGNIYCTVRRGMKEGVTKKGTLQRRVTLPQQWAVIRETRDHCIYQWGK